MTEQGTWKALTRSRVSQAAGLFAVLLVGGGALLMGLASWSQEATGPSWLEAVLKELGALLVVSGALTVLWELLGRRALTDEILAAANLSAEVSGAGLTRVSNSYLSEPEWNALLRSARQLDVFFSYARTWRNMYVTALRELVARPGVTIRVVLPDPSNEGLAAQLAAKFGLAVDELKRRVNDARSDFENLQRQSHPDSVVELRLTSEYPAYTCYRIDDECVIVLYSLTEGRTDVPMLQCRKGGTLYDHVNDQFESLWKGAILSESRQTIGS